MTSGGVLPQVESFRDLLVASRAIASCGSVFEKLMLCFSHLCDLGWKFIDREELFVDWIVSTRMDATRRALND
jgi:hypothetical protein